jgi:hypothetical protein
MIQGVQLSPDPEIDKYLRSSIGKGKEKGQKQSPIGSSRTGFLGMTSVCGFAGVFVQLLGVVYIFRVQRVGLSIVKKQASEPFAPSLSSGTGGKDDAGLVRMRHYAGSR